MASTLVPHYLGGGLLSARPATLDLQPGCVGFYVASDAGISVWQGGVWRQIDSIAALTVTLPDTNYTLTSAEYQGIGRLNLSGTLTATRDTVFPAAFTPILVTNATAQSLVLKKAGQTGTVLAAGATVLVFSGATDVVVFATDLGYVAENTTNKVTAVSGASTDTQYPSAKLLYDQLALKQDALVSAVTIKTINGVSILGSGDLAVSGTGGASIGVQFTADLSATADADPGAGKLRWNNATQASATVMFLDDATVDGANLTAWWPALTAGGFVYLQHPTTQNKWQIWQISAIVDATGYSKLTVALLASGTAFAASDPMLVTLQQGPGGGGGGMTNPMTVAGDIIYGGTAGAATRLAKGANGTRLTMGATNPAWAALIFTEAKSTASPNGTDNAYSLKPVAGTNSDMCLVPTGYGALLAAVPNGLASGGDKRGLYAVDLQLSRAASTQVAYGDYSFIGGGRNAIATIYAATAGGQQPAATGGWSFVGGGEYVTASGTGAGALAGTSNDASGSYSATLGGAVCVSSGYASLASGMSGNTRDMRTAKAHGAGTARQIVEMPLWAKTTAATATVLTADGGTAASTNVFTLPSQSASCLRFQLLARCSFGTGVGDCAAWDVAILIKNLSGTMSIVGSPSLTQAYGDAGASTWAISSISVDATLKSLKVTVTGQTGKDIEWSGRLVGPEC